MRSALAAGLVALFAGAFACGSSAAPSDDELVTETDESSLARGFHRRFVGVDYLHDVVPGPNEIHVTRIDLDLAVTVRATDQAGRNATVPGFAARFGDRRPAVAINGDFFDYAAYQPRGLAVGPSGPWIKCGARELCSDENPDVPGTSTEGVFAADVGTRGTFTGVVHPYGLPGHRLAGAKVRMVGVGIEEADGEGEVHFRVPGGRYTLEVSVPGFTKRTLEVAVPPDHAVTERLWVAARADNDDDGWPNDQDNCPNDANPQQTDDDRDGIGNRCDLDADDDGVPDADDRCPRAPDPAQEDMDDDGFGAACDANDADPVVH